MIMQEAPITSAVDGGKTTVSTAEERLWSIVKSNSLDFNAWTALIEETEKVAEDYISKIEKVYDAYLAEFPLCYGYWKKYADHVARLASVDKVLEVYERAVVSVTYSVDIWLHYCVFSMSLNNEDPETVRSFKEVAEDMRLSEIRTAEASGQGVEWEVHPDDPENSFKPVCAEELEKYVAIREKMYKKAKEFDTKIVGFEKAIRRPYFHVYPLKRSELQNWHNYLDFIEGQDDFNKQHPEIHLFAARFRERRGDIQEARAANIKHANMEHRLDNIEEASSSFEQAIATEKGKEQS
ncbi:hypothetical protein MKX03_025800 [Papaver bracteatum]|nr:hypothetical protein MKX03_025800 [Papaver bracteatum]